MATIQGIKQRYGIIGRSEKLDIALNTALRVASTDLSVLIQGESGVGKESISKVIHDYSPRKHNTFIAINTGALPSGTINSELFGHEKGAFTGATADRKGYFETADKGTIFLDEIGEMPLDTQAYLLRVLESGEFLKVGSSVVRKTDVRVVAATNVDLMQKIKEGKFREDLYYRLNTVPIYVPSLHERTEDIYLLFRKFSYDFSEKYKSEALRLNEDARQIIERYPWPGNIRELRNLVEQLSILNTGDSMLSANELIALAPQLSTRHLPTGIKGQSNERFEEREILFKFLIDMKNDLNDLKSLVFELVRKNNLELPALPARSANAMSRSYNELSDDMWQSKTATPEYNDERPIIISQNTPEYAPQEMDETLSLDEKTKELIVKALRKYKGRRKEASEELGISERTLYRKIKEYDIDL